MTVRGGIIIKEGVDKFMFQRKTKPKDKTNIVKEEIKFRNNGPT